MPKLICFIGGLAFGAGLNLAISGAAPLIGAVAMLIGGLTIAAGLHLAVLRKQ